MTQQTKKELEGREGRREGGSRKGQRKKENVWEEERWTDRLFCNIK